jgi:archaellum component FlaF (FlaF/FlaG flagellin family)
MSSLYRGLVWVTVGLFLMVILMTFGATHAAYQQLRAAAEAAAWSGQSVIRHEPSATSGHQGYFAVSLQQTSDPVQAAQAQWQKSVQQLHLTSMFSNLNFSATVQGNQVTVTATGTFHVPWLDTASRVLFAGQYPVTFEVPMKVTVVGAS